MVHGDPEAEERAHVLQGGEGAVLFGQEGDGVVKDLAYWGCACGCFWVEERLCGEKR